MTDTVKNTINGMKWRRKSQLNFRRLSVMNLTYRKSSGPYVKATNGKEYISSKVLLIRANASSIHIRNSQAAISLFAIVRGFFVDTSNPAKNDWEIPIYNTGSMLTIISDDNYQSKITKASNN
jgi:hypothetical protein